MLVNLSNKLQGIISDTQMELLDDCLKAMSLYKYEITSTNILVFVEGAGQYEPIFIQDSIFDIVIDGLDEVLSLLQVSTIDCPIKVKKDIIRGLYYMENSDQSEFICNVIEGAESTTEAALELLSFFTGQIADTFFPYLSIPENGYIEKLYQLHKPIADLAVEDIMEVDKKVIERCKKFLEKYTHTLTHDAIYQEQYKPGISSDILFEKYNLKLSTFYPNALDQLAIEVVGLMCMSNVENKGFGMQVKKKLDAIIPDPIISARMVMIVDEITMRLGIYA